MLPISRLAGIISQSSSSSAPSSATLSGSTSATATLSQTYTVTLNTQADQTYTITWSTNGTPSSSSTTITQGNTTSSITITWSAATTGTVDFTISPSLTRGGNPKSVNVVAIAPVTSITLTSSTTGAVPWTAGHFFVAGDLPAGSSLAGLQTNVLTTWPNGSAKFAVISGVTALTSGVDSTVSLSKGSPVSGSPITTTILQSTGVVAVIGCDVHGSAIFSGADWLSPERTWVTGPVMSSWVYRKAVDATLAVWVEVRMWSTGEVEMLPWVENGYVTTSGTVSRTGTFTFTLGGTLRESLSFTLPGRTRAVLVSGTKLSHFLAVDPGVVVRHNAPYMISTKLVPNYAVTSPSSVVTSWVDSISLPHEQGRFPSGMGSAGAHPSIGLLPEWDAMYLTNGSIKVWRVVQQQGYRAGRYGIYYRDENTMRPPQATNHTTRVFGGTSGVADAGASTTSSYPASQTGTAPATYKISHHPSIGFMAAVVSGRMFHVETCQFAASIQGLFQSDIYRTWASGSMAYRLLSYMQARGFGWALRTLGQAVVITPEVDPLHAEFVSHLNQTVTYNHSRYVAQSHNPLGWMTEYTPDMIPQITGGPMLGQPFMQDFIMQSMGYLRHLVSDMLSENTKLIAWYEWGAKSIVGRFGGTGSTEYLYRDAANAYQIGLSPTTFPNWNNGSGPWYTDWGDVWHQTYEVTRSVLSGQTIHTGFTFPYNQTVPQKVLGDGSLRDGGIGNDSSYWHNLQPALAYTVEHSIVGAQDAWNKLTTAPNFASGIEAFATTSPHWAVYPRAIPPWVASVLPDTWTSLGTTSLVTWANAGGIPAGAYRGTNPFGAIVDAYADPAFDSVNGKYYFYGGGHGDGSCNAVVEFDNYSLTWSLKGQPMPPSKYLPDYYTTTNPIFYPSGKPFNTGFFLAAADLSDPLDAPYAAPTESRCCTHMYAAASMRGPTVHYFYLTYAEFDTSTGLWAGRGTDLGSQLVTFRPQYGNVPLQQGTVAVYDSVTDKFFVTLCPGDAGGGWRSGIMMFNPTTRQIEAIYETNTSTYGYVESSVNICKIGRELYVFTKLGNYGSPSTMNQGFIFDMDTHTFKKFILQGDIAGSTFPFSSNQETIPSYYDGTAIRRWNYCPGFVNKILSVSIVPVSGTGAINDPLVFNQVERSVSGTLPVGIAYVYSRLRYDAASGVALVLPSSTSSWYVLKLS